MAGPRGVDSRHQLHRREDADARQLRLALAQLPIRMRGALRLFGELTGLSAVASLRAAVEEPGGTGGITPPVHPRCASQLQKTKLDAPCEEQWRRHLRSGLRSRAPQRHVCPLGLRCSCVPIHYGETLVGTAKLVAGPETTDRRFALAARALELAVSRVCQDFHVAALTENLANLQQEMAEIRMVLESARAGDADARSSAAREDAGSTAAARAEDASDGQEGSLVDRTLRHLGAHYLDPALSLAGVSRALGVNGKYLTRLFTCLVGQHMRGYIQTLRVQHACRLLILSDRPIKEIALASGFRRAEGFRRAFQEHVGVAPATYRRIFTVA